MCLILHYKQDRKIAAEDILCFKVVYPRPTKWYQRARYLAEYWDFVYIKGKKYTLNQDLVRHRDPFSNEFFVTKGFHSYMFPPINRPTGTQIVRCIIPKGSQIYTGHVNNSEIRGYVSNQIIIKGKF